MGVLPSSLKIKPPVRTSEGWQLAQKFGRQFLKLRIGECHKAIQSFTATQEKLLKNLHSKLDPVELVELKAVCQSQMRREYTSKRLVHIKKLQYLQNDSVKKRHSYSSKREKWVLNISSNQLTDTERLALEKGMNFAVTPRTIPLAEIVAGVEDGITSSSDEEKIEIRSKVSEILRRAKPPPSNISKNEIKALKNLSRDKTRLVIQSDKGNCTVVMDRSDYDSKVRSLLNDEKTYKVLKKDPTAKIERDLNRMLLRLKRENKIDETLYKYLHSSDGLPPRFYGLPKVHKPEFPLRPNCILYQFSYLQTVQTSGMHLETPNREHSVHC